MNIVNTIGAIILCYAFYKIVLQYLKILMLFNKYKSGKIEYKDTYEIKVARLKEIIPIYGFVLLVGIIICSVGIILALDTTI